MAKIINASIDLTKIRKERIITKNKNGQPFQDGKQLYSISIVIADEPDKYGNNVSIRDNQTKEERERKDKVNYIGNGKVVWSGESKQKQKSNYNESPKYAPSVTDDLPF